VVVIDIEGCAKLFTRSGRSVSSIIENVIEIVDNICFDKDFKNVKMRYKLRRLEKRIVRSIEEPILILYRPVPVNTLVVPSGKPKKQ